MRPTAPRRHAAVPRHPARRPPRPRATSGYGGAPPRGRGHGRWRSRRHGRRLALAGVLAGSVLFYPELIVELAAAVAAAVADERDVSDERDAAGRGAPVADAPPSAGLPSAALPPDSAAVPSQACIVVFR